MNLIDENIERESEEKQKKLTKIIIITIAVLIFFVIAILGYSAIRKKNTLKVSIDGKNTSFDPTMFLMQDKKNLEKSENGEIYISVKLLSQLLNVGFYNDEFNGGGEDTSKCYIKTENEYTSYLSNPNRIYKAIDNKELKNAEKNNKNNGQTVSEIELLNDYEYQNFTIENGVKYINNEIYATQKAIELGFNIAINYDEKSKNISITTIEGMENIAKNAVGDYVAIGAESSYNNKKLLKHGFVLIKNGAGEYGLTNYVQYKQGYNALSCKYSKIEYIESFGGLIVTASENNKVGIFKIDTEGSGGVDVVIEPRYDSITQLSKEGRYYLVKEGERYGIESIDITELGAKSSTVLKTEYECIGLENPKDYSGEETSKYILNNKYIPIKKDNKWGLASLNGDILIAPRFDLIGCNVSKTGNPVVVIEVPKKGKDLVVFGNIIVSEDQKETDSRYILVDAGEGKVIENIEAKDMYSLYKDDKNLYYMNVIFSNGSILKYDIIEYFGG